MRFIQRELVGGSYVGDVTFTGVEARILDKNGQVVRDWTTGTGGAGVLQDVPQGDGYRLEVRGSSGSVTTDTVAIGVMVASLGQSNMQLWYRNPTAIPAASGTYQMESNGSWSPVEGPAARYFSALLSAELGGVPIALFDAAKGGTSLAPEADKGNGNWTDTGPDSLYANALNKLALAGGKVEFVLWSQGETDGSAGISTDRYAELFRPLLTRILSDYNAHVYIQELGPHGTATGEARYANIRLAQHIVDGEFSDVSIGATTTDLQLLDSEHLTGASRVLVADRMAISVLADHGIDIARPVLPGASDGADVLTGNGGRNEINALGGDDSIDAGGDSDVVHGGLGNDSISGAAGFDILLGDGGNDTIDGGADADAISGGDGSDSIRGGGGDDEIWSDSGDDSVDGGAGNDYIQGGAGTDVGVYLGAQSGYTVAVAADGTLTVRDIDPSNGDDGVDTLVGFEFLQFAGVLVVPGGATDLPPLFTTEDDFVDFNDPAVKAGTYLNGTQYAALAGSDEVVLPIDAAAAQAAGYDLTQSFNAGAGNDKVTGGNANDTILGGDGDDTLDGGAGDDRTDGGPGNDVYYVNVTASGSTGDIVFERPDEGTDTVISTVTHGLKSNVENLTLVGTAAINGTGNELANIIIGNSSANTLNGSGGADHMEGGGGDDRYIVDDPLDVIVEQPNEGYDRVDSSVNYVLSANLDRLVLTGTGNINGTGNDLNNRIDGTAGNNVLDGGTGADDLRGLGGDDTYYVDDVLDVANEADNSGTDLVISSVTYTLRSFVENLTLTGSTNIDGTGNASNNVIQGNDGDNKLKGAGGNDSIQGGLGADTAVYGASRTSYSIVYDAATQTFTVTDNRTTPADGTDTVSGVEFFQFSDRIYTAQELGGPSGTNTAPVLGGFAAGQGVADTGTLAPFAGVTVTDADSPAQTLTVTVALDAAAKGAFTAASLTASGFVAAGAGSYSFSGTAAAAQAALRQLVFDPADNRVGVGLTETTTFTVSVSDGVAPAVTDSSTTVVSTSQNDAPVAVADSYGATAGQVLTVAAASGVLANDSDVDPGTVLQAALASGPLHGSLTLNPNGSFSYTPTAGYVGSDSFTYTAQDGSLGSTPATVSLTVGGAANTAPVLGGFAAGQGVADTGTLAPFAGVTVTDADSPAQTLTVTVALDAAAKGAFTAASLTASGFVAAGAGSYSFSGTAAAAQAALRQLVFDPADNRVGVGLTETTTFTVSVSDGVAPAVTDSSTTVVSTSQNDAPVAVADSYGATAGQVLTVAAASGVLANDSDVDPGTVLQAALASGPLHGSLTLNPNGSFSYTPTAGYVGSDSFTYTAQDGSLGSTPATVSLTVGGAANTAPVLGGFAAGQGVADTGTLAPFAGVTVTDADSPAQTLTVTVALDAAAKGAFTAASLTASGFVAAGAGSYSFSGTAAAAQAALRQLVFDPADNRVGVGLTETTTFTVSVSDGVAPAVTDSSTTVVSTSQNDAPVAVADSYGATAGQVLTVAAASGVLANDSDVDPGTVLQAALASGPLHGSLTLNPNGSFSYTPTAGYVGSDSFTYTAQDGSLGSTPATVSLTVGGASSIDGTSRADKLVGTSANDLIQGLGGNDTIQGLAGDDTLDGGSGADRMEGGQGNDTYYVAQSSDNTVELTGEGIDQVISSVSQTLKTNVENLTLTGSSNTYGYGNNLDNLIIGSNGSNNLKGADGQDTLNGGLGNDSLEGGAGRDVLSGEGGNDRYIFRSDVEIGGGDTGLSSDLVFDFNTGDRIDVSPIDARTNASGNNAFTFIGSGAFTGISGQLHALFDAGTNLTYIEGDLNGDGVADFRLEVATQHVFSAGDFYL